MDVDREARSMLDAAERDEQCARRIHDDGDAAAIRKRVRALARERGLHIRTARMDDTVVVVREDAAVWHEDQATMRRKLSAVD